MLTISDPVTVANRLRPVLLQLSRQLRRELAALGITGGQAALMHAIRAWSEENIDAVLDARDAYDERAAQEVQPITA